MEVGYPRNVRARTTASRSAPDASRRKKIAQAISARLRAKFPYKDYGVAHYMRGSPNSLSTFGQSYKLADENQRMNRRNSGFSGRGAYWGKTAGSYLGRAGAGMLASAVGLPELAPMASGIGGKLGGMAGDFLSDKIMGHLRGRGSYTTHALVNNVNMTPDRMVNTVHGETGDIIFSHSEYLQDITPTSALFQTQYFQPINPGLPGYAPWLAQIAGYFEEYELIQCVYTFKSMVTEGNSTAAGTVVMATQYNPTNQPFTAKQAMENYEYANSCKVTDNLIHGVECDPQKHGGPAIEYVRTAAVPTGQDPKTYDLGVVQLATSGCTPNLNLGELWVHYRVRLSKAKIVLPGGFPSPNDILTASVRFKQTGAAQTNFNNLLGNLPAGTFTAVGTAGMGFATGDSAFSDNSGAMTLAVNNVIGFPPYVNGGRYLVMIQTRKMVVTDSGGYNWTASGASVLRSGYIPNTGIINLLNGYWAIIDINSVSGVSATIQLQAITNVACEATSCISVYQMAGGTNVQAFTWGSATGA